MYCVKCGVKLADTEKECPLCRTTAYHPDIKQEDEKSTYPKTSYPAREPHPLGFPIFATAVLLLPFVVVLLCDLRFSKSITWSGYVMGAILLTYEMFILPLWFRRRNPVIFVPCAFAAIGIYLLYINFASGGTWFLSFAFPILGSIAVIVTTTVVLLRYIKRGALYIWGGALMAFGAMMPLLEFLLYYTFEFKKVVGWAFYPMVSFGLLGGLLIFLAICRPAREVMERKFFI
jgi:hypothetical protein